MTPLIAKQLQENPRTTANLISKLLFLYTIPIFRNSQKEEFSTEDLYKPLEEHGAEHVRSRFCKAWEKEVLLQHEKGATPGLLRPIGNVFGRLIVSLGLILFSLDFCVKLTQPIFLGMLLSQYSGVQATESTYLYAGALILCSVVNVLFTHTVMLGQFHCGMKIRIALMGLVYRKALRLSKTALGKITSGKVLNILTSDVSKIDSAMLGLHQIWLGPLETVTVVVLVYYHIGFSAVAGIVVLGLLVPAQLYIGKQMVRLRKLIAERSDVRIRLMNEIVQGVQVIKMYCWEKPFGKVVAAAREQEVNVLRRSNYLRGINLSCMMFISRIAIFTSLVIYALLGYIVTAEKAFVITAYYNILRQVMTVQFPRGIEQIGETKASLKRIEEFLLAEERKEIVPKVDKEEQQFDPTSTTPLLANEKCTDISAYIIDLVQVKAKWNIETKDFILNNVSFSVHRGEHVAIAGQVGSGKSSILQVILGELPLMTGIVEMNSSSLSYAPQEPWLFNGSIQQNILFGQKMDVERYKKVVVASALHKDLTHFSNGDETLVGDRGQTLSGGQKARIGLARAIYREADIYLLDDPLSAVDMQVGRHLMDDCIRGFLHYRTVLLVTHQLQFLDKMDRIVVLDHGQVNMIGTFSELKDQHPTFKTLLAEVNENELSVNDEERGNDDKFGACPLSNEYTSKRVPDQVQIRETQRQGAVGTQLYLKYIKSGGGFFLFTIVMLSCAATQLFASGSDYFLAFWVNREKVAGLSTKEPVLDNNSTTHTTSVEAADSLDMFSIFVFTGLTVGTILVTLFRTALLFEVAMKASIKLHNIMYNGVIRATMYFFETNPAGRIINRFSKDMAMVDDTLPGVMVEVIQIAMALAGVVIIVASISAWSLLPSVAMAVLFYYLRRFYLKTSRKLRRMDGVARSPIYSHVVETLTGLSTIQAFSAENQVLRAFDAHQDLHSSVFYTILATARAFGFCLDAVCVLYIIFVTFSALNSATAGEVGLAITQAVGVTGMLQWGIRQSAEMENLMTCVERIVEYEGVDREQSKSDAPPPKDWPTQGHIMFEKVSLWYSPSRNANAALNDLSFEIRPNEKIGIVGRTGAGKSSLVNAIFQLSFTEGSIRIDGRNIAEMALECLRWKISIIPQEPILFSGSVRYNLDPFEEYPDDRLWQVLAEVHLKELISRLSNGLHSDISEGGSNLSLGERQLICLARAMLRDNKILIMDEATANVDGQTDSLIQSTIRKKFNDDCTVLVIAHRLHTVMDLNRVLVVNEGRVTEFDTPDSLLSNQDSILYIMAKEAGQATFDSLKQIARKAKDSIGHERSDD